MARDGGRARHGPVDHGGFETKTGWMAFSRLLANARYAPTAAQLGNFEKCAPLLWQRSWIGIVPDLIILAREVEDHFIQLAECPISQIFAVARFVVCVCMATLAIRRTSQILFSSSLYPRRLSAADPCTRRPRAMPLFAAQRLYGK